MPSLNMQALGTNIVIEKNMTIYYKKKGTILPHSSCSIMLNNTFGHDKLRITVKFGIQYV